jgi:hemerythrin-like domain-containing protein
MLGKVLHEEHFRILVSVCHLQNRVSGEAGEKSFDQDDDQEQEEMHNLVSTLDCILAHHAFEENVVFPLIHDDDGSDVADLLEEEHLVIEPITRRLRTLAIEILKHGPGDGRWPEFRTAGQRLFAKMLNHLENEEAIVLQRLDRWLDAATDHRLALQHSSRLLPSIASGSGISH